MAETQPTPGPWEVYIGGNFIDIGTAAFVEHLAREHSRSHQGRVTGMTHSHPLTTRDRATAVANAHLIAAAPDLYDALEALLAESTPDNPVAEAAHNQACAALAKARGDST